MLANSSQENVKDPRQRKLRKLQLIAIALLITAIFGLVLSEVMGGEGLWAWLKAFSEAAAVGAMADWFAVVALFRRPMGLPIPHTAIIPNNKDRVAENLAALVRDKFLDSKELLEKLRILDPAARLGQWLSEPEQVRAWTGMARKFVLEGLDLLDEAVVRKAIRDYVTERLEAWDVSGSAGNILALLTRDGRHQQLLDGALEKIGAHLKQEKVKARISDLIARKFHEEYPKAAWTIDLFSKQYVGDKAAHILVEGLMNEMQEVLSAPQHQLRLEYEGLVMDYIERLRKDPDVVLHINNLKLRAIKHPVVQKYVEGIWGEIHSALRLDLSREDSRLTSHLEQTLLAMGQRLSSDFALRSVINDHVLAGADKLAPKLREYVTTHIVDTVKAWKNKELVDELELSIGRDLQFIRFNGTVVGGIIGVGLYWLSLTLGHVF